MRKAFLYVRFSFLLLSIILITSCGEKTASDLEEKKNAKAVYHDKIEAFLNLCADYGKFNGSALVARDGEIIYKNGFGLANMEWDIPNKANTKHRLASVTKQFVGMLIVQLVSENKLELHVPISKYLPDYPKKNAEQITIHHLLTHTSGTPNYTSFPNYRQLMPNRKNPEELLALYADATLLFPPGERFEYSNSGYVTLGIIIEKITGQTFEEVLKEKILEPLQMNDTGYDKNAVVLKNRASAYYKMAGTFVNANHIDMSVAFTAGCMYSTVEDMYLWDQALYTDQLLPKKYRDLLFAPHIESYGAHYGYGWDVGKIRIGDTDEYLESVGHSGGINGFTTLITRMPSENIVVILLNNAGDGALRDMTEAISGILFDKSYRLPKKSIANTMLDVIHKNGIEAGLSFYETVKDSANYYLSERELNIVGYDLLQSGQIEDAEKLFKLNVAAHPNAFNVYDSYAEALMLQGKKEESIENYKKSVRLNPDNRNAVRILEKLGVDVAGLAVKLPKEQLELLKGDYLATNQPTDKEWKITIEIVDGQLMGNDKGYRYKLIPIAPNKFVNPDDGALLNFDTSDEKGISFIIFEKVHFEKVQE